jgi:hypothetical protein
MTLSQNSNVVHFISMLKKDNKREQMVYYQVMDVPLDATFRSTDTRISGRYRDLYLKPRPRVYQCHNPPVFQRLGPSGRLEFASSHPMYVHR